MQRFWSRVKKTRKCWLWQGSTNPDGYGWFWFKGKNRRAHRVAWMLMRGNPGAAHVLHTCDTPQCVNPRHLYLGGPADNMRDKVQRGRQTRGVAVNTAKLNPKKVREIRARRARGETLESIRVAFELSSVQYVRRIVNREVWKHV